MRSYQVIINEQAHEQIEALALFYLEVSQNLTLAERVRRTIYQQLGTLEQMPMRFISAGFANRCIRKMSIAKFPIVIYFEVVADTVIILHIAHARSNHQANFSQIYQ